MKNPLIDITSQILSLPTAPYKENSVRDFILDFCSQRKMGLRQDEFGNLIVFAKRKYPTGSLAFVANMDHPGFVIEKKATKGTTTALFMVDGIISSLKPLLYQSIQIRGQSVLRSAIGVLL